jgi:hypothetical protein
LLEWLELWPENQLLNLLSSDLKRDPNRVTGSLLKFFGAHNTSLGNSSNVRLNEAEGTARRSNNATMSVYTRHTLSTIFKIHLEWHHALLRKLINREIEVLIKHFNAA